MLLYLINNLYFAIHLKKSTVNFYCLFKNDLVYYQLHNEWKPVQTFMNVFTLAVYFGRGYSTVTMTHWVHTCKNISFKCHTKNYRSLTDGWREGLWWSAPSGHGSCCPRCWSWLLSMKCLLNCEYVIPITHLSWMFLFLLSKWRIELLSLLWILCMFYGVSFPAD